MKQSYKVWDSQHNSMTEYTPYECYKITVNYPNTNRTCLLYTSDAADE